MKNPTTAAVCGVLLGAIGVGLYLQSFKHFAICAVIQFATLLIPIPPLNFLISWGAAALYGYMAASEG